MSEKDLTVFLPTIGDRLSLKIFVEEQIKKKSGKEGPRKEKLLHTLKAKLGIVPSNNGTALSSDEEPETVPCYTTRSKTKMARIGNKSAQKETRKFELGWIHNGKAIRNPRGGGTRKMEMLKVTKKDDILVQGKALFFPDGTSTFGSENKFSFNIADSSQRDIGENTIEELYTKSKMTTVRLYMITKDNFPKESDPSDVKLVAGEDDENNLPDLQKQTVERQATNLPQQSGTYVEKSSPKSLTKPNKPNEENIVLLDNDKDFVISFDMIPQSCLLNKDGPPKEVNAYACNLQPDVETNLQTIQSIPTSFDTSAPTKSPLSLIDDGASCSYVMDIKNYDPEVLFGVGLNEVAQNATDFRNDTLAQVGCVKEMTVKRGLVFEDVMKFFLETDFNCSLDILQVIMLSEKGEDSGGVFRDMISEYWDSFYQKHTIGSEVRIPTTAHIMREEQWKAVAKVLICGYRQEKYLPIQLSQVFLQRCLDGKEVCDDQLVETFLSTLSPLDKDVFSIALSDFPSVDEDDLWELCSTYEARVAPTQSNIKKLIKDIAHHQVIQKPSFVTECWSKLLQEELSPLLPESGLETLYSSLKVTHKKVLQSLKFPESISKADKNTVDALKQYLRRCSKEKLTSFIRFTSGSDLLVGKEITVRITPPMSPFTLRPIAHTCGCILELSSSYDNFLLLREHLDNVLDSKMLRMDIV